MYRVSPPRRCAQRLVRVAFLLLVIGWMMFQGLPVSVKFAQGQASSGSSEKAFDDTGITSIVINPLNVAREGHTATLLQNGQVLVAGGRNTSGPLQSAQLYNPATGRWEAADDLNTPRHGHTAVLLQNGRVLIAGGQNGSAFLNTAELYDPDKNQWTVINNAMRAARSRHTASLLRNGRVLVAGGENDSGSLQSAEEFDPSTNTWSLTKNNLTTARREHTATLLANDQVLVTGGRSSDTAHLRSAELYDPDKQTWSPTGGMGAARRLHTATRLTDTNGRELVLVAGGRDGSGVHASSELYNPIKRTWTTTLGSLNPPRHSHTATLLTNGRVLVAGGTGIGSALQSAQVYDPQAKTWSNSATLNLSAARSAHTATLLASSKVLIVAGNDNLTFLDSVELLDLQAQSPGQSAGAWTVTRNLATGQQSNLLTPRQAHTATLLPDGQVLVAGGAGSGGATLASAELYDPAKGTWSESGNLNVARHSHTATLLRNGQVLVVGGRGTGGPLDSAELYDPATKSSSLTISEMNLARIGHTATLLADGRVLVAGGAGTEKSAELYNPATGTWSLTGMMNSARQDHSATLLANGKVLVAGGTTGGGAGTLDSAELFDPAQGTWTSTDSMGPAGPARRLHAAVLLPDGRVLVAGGRGRGSGGNVGIILGNSQLYDPEKGTWSAGLLLTAARVGHTATLLANGKVLLAGGYTGGFNTPVQNVELYDPAVGTDGLGLQTLSFTGPLKTPRYDHTATLLRDGQVLVAGGAVSDSPSSPPLNSGELYDLGLGYSEASRPVLTGATWSGPGSPLDAQGIRFQGLSEASGGDGQSSASNYPLLQLRHLDSGRTLFLLPDPARGWSNNLFTSMPVAGLPAGPTLVTAFINGIPSVGQLLLPGSSPRTASISGRVTNINGAGMAGVTMTLTSRTTGETRTTLTGPNGEYSFTDLVIFNPQPVSIAGLTPASKTAGEDGFLLTVDGNGFVDGSLVLWNESGRSTTFVSSKRLTALIPKSDIATAGTANVTVVNPDGSTSNARSFTINRPAPAVLSNLVPPSTTAGGLDFTLTVNGTGFVSGSMVRWVRSNGSFIDRPPISSVSPTQLRVTIPQGEIANPGTVNVRVVNPGNIVSTNQLPFTINPAPAPRLTSMNPHSATAGGPGFQLTIFGTGFVSGSTVQWGGSNRATQFVSPTQLRAQILTSDLGTARTVSMTVGNPGSLPSNELCFTITPPPPPPPPSGRPALARFVERHSIAAGSSSFDLTIVGTGFRSLGDPEFPSISRVRWNGQIRQTTFVNSTMLRVRITAADIAQPGRASVTVVDPITSIPISNELCFTITPPVVLVFVGPSLAEASSASAPEPEPDEGQAQGPVEYTVTPSATTPDGRPVEFSPSNRTYSSLSGDVTDANFAAIGPTYTIGGTVTGLNGTMVEMTLTLLSNSTSPPRTAMTRMSGTYDFTNCIYLGDYQVTAPANHPSYSFTPPDGHLIPGLDGLHSGADFTATPTCASPAITSQPASLTQCVGQSATFSVAAAGTGLTYQWRESGTAISGATSSSYSITAVAASDAGNYDVIVTGSCGSVTSNAATLTVSTPPAITSQPVSLTKCVGQSATFSVTATGTGLTYQWRENGANIPGATAGSYALASVGASDAGSYDVVISGACSSAVTSTTATLTVHAAPAITAQPSNQTVCVGAPASFSVTASGTGPFSYQWRKNGAAINGATNSSYNIAAAAASDAGSYDVVVTGACGSVTSSAASLTINTPPSVTADPTDQTVCAGASVTFTAAASGAPTVQWQVSADGGASFADLSGMTSPTLTFTASAAQNGNRYRAVFTSACGSATTAVATLTVSACTPALMLSYNGLLRDRVGQGETALSSDTLMDGTFTVALQAGSGNRTVTSLQLTRSGNSGIWDTIPSNGFWVLGAANSLEAPLLNSATGAVSFAVADGGSFTVFASDFNNSLFGPGSSFALTVNFADGSTATAGATVPGEAIAHPLMPSFAIFNYAPGGGFFNPLGFIIVRSVMSFGIGAKEA